jgi:hypothetical protein
MTTTEAEQATAPALSWEEALMQRLETAEQRIAQLEKAAHTEHTLSADTIKQIVDAAVLQMHSHFQRVFGLGKSLLQEDKA